MTNVRVKNLRLRLGGSDRVEENFKKDKPGRAKLQFDMFRKGDSIRIAALLCT